MMPEIVSYGAGVNSTALAVLLANEGRRIHLVFADTGGEHEETYAALETMAGWAEKRGLPLTIIRPPSPYHIPSKNRTVEDYCLAYRVIPLIGWRWCTWGWKRDPIAKWKRENAPDAPMHIAIAADEAHRAVGEDVLYELVARQIGRPECKEIIRQEGLPVPPKSGCWFCPYQRWSQAMRLADMRPDLWERWLRMEAAVNARQVENGHAPISPKFDGLSLTSVRKQWLAQGRLFVDEDTEIKRCVMCGL